MVGKSALVALLFVVVEALAGQNRRVSSTQQCGEGAHYSECGTACPRTCSNPDAHNEVCIGECKQGCFCNEGLVWDNNGNCIPVEECPTSIRARRYVSSMQQCGEGAHYSECGTACPRTCSNPDAHNEVCSGECKQGCFCNEGLVWDNNGNCIPVEQCPTSVRARRYVSSMQQCGEGAHYSECGTACPRTCSNPDAHNEVCSGECKQGCFCNEGLVWDNNGNCIPVEQCPISVRAKRYVSSMQQCGEGAHYSECGTACPRTCSNPDAHNEVCSGECKQGCFCNEGLVWDNNGNCIPVEQCPTNVRARRYVSSMQQCGEGAHYTDCGTACPRTCRNPNAHNKACTLECKPGCFCDGDLVRDDYGNCVPVEECPTTELSPGECVRGEMWNDCGFICQPSCANRFPACDKKCHAGCYCPEGFIRRDESTLSPCIPIRQCRQ